MSLLSVDFSSTAAGYQWIRSVELEGHKLLEAAVLGPKAFWVLIESTEDLTSLSGSASANSHFKSLKLIQSSELLYREALLHLTSTKVQDSLVVLESETVSALLDVIETLSTSAKFQIMDIQVRGLGGMSLSYLTCEEGETDTIYGSLQGLADRLYNFEVLRELPPELEAYFPKA